jgi:competence protein ComEC
MVLPWLAAAWMAGLAADPVVSFSLWQWATLAFVAVAAAWATRREPRLGWCFLALAVAFLGALRASAAELQRDQNSLAAYARTSEPVDVYGSVVASPTRWGDKYTFDLRAEGILIPGESTGVEAEGLVRVISATSLPAARAEAVVLHGRLRPARPFEGPRSSAVLEAASIRRLAPPPRLHPIVLLDRLRGHMVDRLYQALPYEEASLVAGVLLGADEGMPDHLQDAFRVTGTAHVLAVSGFNVTVVAAAAAAAFGALLGARRGALAAGAAVILYTLLCGAEASVVRAAIMACAALLALRLGRQPAALTSLAAAAILMSLVDPPVIYDVGFQLSFLATLGLILAGRPAQEAIRRWGRAVGRRAERPSCSSPKSPPFR